MKVCLQQKVNIPLRVLTSTNLTKHLPVSIVQQRKTHFLVNFISEVGQVTGAETEPLNFVPFEDIENSLILVIVLTVDLKWQDTFGFMCTGYNAYFLLIVTR